MKINRITCLIASVLLIAQAGPLSAQSGISASENVNKADRVGTGSRTVLRYGNRLPKTSAFNERVLRQGVFLPTIRRFGSGNVNRVYTGTILFEGSSVKVLIKPDIGLYDKDILRANIPTLGDNRRADAAFHLNKFLNLVDTPEHVIRNDAPIEEDNPRTGGAGVQIFVENSADADREIINLVRTSGRLIEELEQIAIFDSIIGNWDRHNGNWRFRKSPSAGQRHIVAIDNTLSFPVNRKSVWGHFNMVEWFGDSTRRGVISPANLKILDNLVGNRQEIEKVLRLNLEQEAIDLMWDRVARMRRTKKVIAPRIYRPEVPQSESALIIENLHDQMAPKLKQIQRQYNVHVVTPLASPGTELWRVTKRSGNDVSDRLKDILGKDGLTVFGVPGDYRNLVSVAPAGIRLSKNQERVVSSIRRSTTEDQFTIVQLAPMALTTHALIKGYDERDGLPSRGSLKLVLNKTLSITASKSSAQFTENGYVWRGKVSGGRGDVLIIANGDSLTGTARVDDQIFSIRPLGGGLHAVIERRTNSFPPEHPPRTFEKFRDQGFNRDLPPRPSLDPNKVAFIDVVVAYTQNAAENYTDIKRDLINLAIEETNQSFRDSGISNLILRLVHSYKTDYRESAVWNDHIDKFSGDNDGVMDQVHTIRKDHAGDIAILIMNHDQYCGEAKEILARSSTAFAVVHHSCATGYYSFAHEIGHLFGARHDIHVDPEVRPYAHGHGFLNGFSWRTIMGYGNGCNQCRRIARWSNPNTEIEGQKAGTLSREYNVKVLRDNALAVASFKN